MKRKCFVLLTSLFLSTLSAFADNVNGLFVTVSGSTKSYKLEDTPTITYGEENGVKVAQLTLKGTAAPVLSIQLKDGATLQTVYGTYVPSAIKNINSNVVISNQGGKKIISGGQLIIIGKDGKQYNINGTIIK